MFMCIYIYIYTYTYYTHRAGGSSSLRSISRYSDSAWARDYGNEYQVLEPTITTVVVYTIILQ